MSSSGVGMRVIAILDARRPALHRLPSAAGLATLVLLIFAFALPNGDVEAASVVKIPTVLELQTPTSVELGTHPSAFVRLTANGAPLKGQLISIRLGARISQQVTTGADGTATTDIEQDLSAGRYQVTATFAGTAVYRSASSVKLILTVTPVELTIATVPPMRDLPLLQVDGGAVARTDADGVVHVTVTKVGNVALRLALPADGPSLRLRLDRWDDGSVDPLRTIRIPDTRQVTVGLQILYPLQFAFHASGGVPIDTAEVPVVAIADRTGAEQTLSGPAPYWLRANAITRLASGLVSTQVEYRVVSVPLDGADVVNRGQQRFTADRAKTVELQLLVFYLSIQGRDALFKTSSGSTVSIAAENGATQTVTLDRDARATVRLSRGVYRISLGGSIGIPLSTPVALSRDQEVDILLLSLLDFALVFAVGLFLVFGLIVIGRPHVLRRRKRGPSSTPPNADPPGPAWPTSPPGVPEPRADP